MEVTLQKLPMANLENVYNAMYSFFHFTYHGTEIRILTKNIYIIFMPAYKSFNKILKCTKRETVTLS
jgi:hypothetical protein